VPLPAHGSVAGTALHLARRLSSAPIVFAGLDLAHHDIRSHAPGHSFDPLLMASVGRRRPIEQVYYERAARSGALTGRAAHSALSAYARWFSRISDRKQLYILHTRPPTDAMQSIGEDEFESLLPHSPPPQLWSVAEHEGGVPADRLLTALAERIERESAPLLWGKAQIAEVRNYLTEHPLLKAFLELVDKPSVLKLLRRQRYGGNIEEPREELAEKVNRQLHRLRTPEKER
jgi:hypothetical protein